MEIKLLKNKVLPFEYCDIYRSNLSFGYLYIYIRAANYR